MKLFIICRVGKMMTSIIAEIGVNWDGDFDLAKEMMNMAKKYGCDLC